MPIAGKEKELTTQTLQNEDAWEETRKKREEQLRQRQIEDDLDEKEQRNKNSRKIEKFRIKEEYRINKQRVKKRRWFSFFSVWFFMGISSIAVGVILDAFWNPQCGGIVEAVSHVIPGLFNSIGVALMIGAIFDFAKNSEHFVAAVADILSQVVLSKNFLTMLTDKNKEEALEMILRPSKKQIKQYPNINALFKKRVKEFSTMFDINFKTNLCLEVRAYKSIDKATGQERVYCETTATQTIYKIGEEFVRPEVHFEKDGSEVLSVVVLPPEGDAVPLKATIEEKNSGSIKCKVYTYDIPKELYRYDHLTIKRVMVEPGFGHWINFYWQSITPYEGVTFSLACEEGLTVKDYMIFDNRAAYHVACTPDNRRLEITASQWLDADTGFAITVSADPDEQIPHKTSKARGRFFYQGKSKKK